MKPQNQEELWSWVGWQQRNMGLKNGQKIIANTVESEKKIWTLSQYYLQQCAKQIFLYCFVELNKIIELNLYVNVKQEEKSGVDYKVYPHDFE